MNSCPICQTKDSVVFKFDQRSFPIWGCGRCSVHFVSPQPSEKDLKKIYTADYFERGDKYGKAGSGSLPEATKLNEQVKVNLLEKHGSKGRLLDIGCATGAFLNEARERGFQVEGVEISQEASARARAQYGVKVHNDLFAPELIKGSFDVITLWDVIEHLSDPQRMLGRARELMAPKGMLFLSTGDISAFWARISGRHWPLLTPPQHLFFFTPQSMQIMLQDAGFKEILITHSMGKHVHGKLLNLKMSESFGWLGRSASALSRALGLDQRSYHLNMGDIMVVSARRPS